MKGSYILILHLPQACSIRVGRLGKIDFPEGEYAYIGSAMNSLEARVARHLRKRKKLHWHIDYLLRKGAISQVVAIESETKSECDLAVGMQKRLLSVKGFGCSDCCCPSHLFYNPDPEKIEAAVKELAGSFPGKYAVLFSGQKIDGLK